MIGKKKFGGAFAVQESSREYKVEDTSIHMEKPSCARKYDSIDANSSKAASFIAVHTNTSQVLT